MRGGYASRCLLALGLAASLSACVDTNPYNPDTWRDAEAAPQPAGDETLNIVSWVLESTPAAAAGSNILGLVDDAPCTPPGWPDAFLLHPSPSQWMSVRFRVEEPGLVGLFGLAGADRSVAGAFADRVAGAAFLERDDGTLVPGGGQFFLAHPFGTRLEVLTHDVDLTTEHAGSCVGFYQEQEHFLGPGVYRYVVLGAAEGEAAYGGFLPSSVIPLDDPEAGALGIHVGSSTRMSETDFACAANVRVTTGGTTTEALTDCTQSVSTNLGTYRLLFTGSGPDSEHEVYWIHGGARLELAHCGSGGCVDYGRYAAEPGASWLLNVPRYVSVAQSKDSGVFGAIAEIPLPRIGPGASPTPTTSATSLA